MKKSLLTLSLFGFVTAMALPLLMTSTANAHACPDGYHHNSKGKCVRSSRGSHG